jgi:hypothetical protein
VFLAGSPVVGAGPREEVAGEEDDVIAPLAERGKDEGQDGQPVVKIFAEALLPRGDRQVGVGGRDDPHVHWLAVGGA